MVLSIFREIQLSLLVRVIIAMVAIFSLKRLSLFCNYFEIFRIRDYNVNRGYCNKCYFLSVTNPYEELTRFFCIAI